MLHLRLGMHQAMHQLITTSVLKLTKHAGDNISQPGTRYLKASMDKLLAKPRHIKTTKIITKTKNKITNNTKITNSAMNILHPSSSVPRARRRLA